MKLSRRSLLKAGIGASLLSGSFTTSPAKSAQNQPTSMPNSRKIVLLELTGGNDALNTVVPITNAAYYKARPTLAIAPECAIKLNEQFGFHPAMKALADLYKAGHVAVVQGVGYPNPSKSHVRARQIWQTLAPERLEKEAWTLTYNERAKKAIQNSGAVTTAPLSATVIRSNPAPDEVSAETEFRQSMRAIAAQIAAGSDDTIFSASLDGFDTHENQSTRHANLLEELSSTVTFFLHDLQARNVDERNVLIMVYSEFGRSLKENAQKGTDHGTSGTALIIGTAVKGGFYGSLPTLTQRETTTYTTDFRSIYQTLLSQWLRSEEKLLRTAISYDTLSFV